LIFGLPLCVLAVDLLLDPTSLGFDGSSLRIQA
jgi:hypothetical protein